MIHGGYRRTFTTNVSFSDKNPDDRDRAEQSFDILKKAIKTIEDPDELSRCREMYTEAKARLAIVLSEKKRKLRREGKDDRIPEDEPDGYAKALWVTVTKVGMRTGRKASGRSHALFRSERKWTVAKDQKDSRCALFE